jgi:hypothetical protein
VTEHTDGAGAGSILARTALVEDATEEIEVLTHEEGLPPRMVSVDRATFGAYRDVAPRARDRAGVLAIEIVWVERILGELVMERPKASAGVLVVAPADIA